MTHRPYALALLTAVALACGASRGGDPATPPAPAPGAPAPPEPFRGAPAPAAPKLPDLDRPVEALLAERCEHARPTFECDECRYGVGVVRVPARLVETGLVQRATVERRRVDAPVSLTGEIRFDERRVTHLSPRAEGIVRRVHAALGERVRPGQPLVELESVQVGEAESEFLSARAALRLATASEERQAQLRREQISSERELLAARQELEAARIRARAAEERLARLGASRAELERLAAAGRSGGDGALVVRAPADGIVLEMHAVPGELVKPEASMLTIGDVSSVWVWADLHEDQLGRLLDAQRAGRLRAEVAVKAFPGATFPGAVELVGPSMDERTRTVKLRVVARNPDARLRAGMFASVRIDLPGEEEALAVPAAAVLADEGRAFAFVHHHGDYWIRRPVEPGRRWGGWVEVRGGLAAGQAVAADGAFLLKSDVLRSKMGAGCAD